MHYLPVGKRVQMRPETLNVAQWISIYMGYEGHTGADSLSSTLGVKEWSISPSLIFLNQIHTVINIQEKHEGKMI